jgi:hypothetical protein
VCILGWGRRCRGAHDHVESRLDPYMSIKGNHERWVELLQSGGKPGLSLVSEAGPSPTPKGAGRRPHTRAPPTKPRARRRVLRHRSPRRPASGAGNLDPIEPRAHALPVRRGACPSQLIPQCRSLRTERNASLCPEADERYSHPTGKVLHEVASLKELKR